MEGTPFGRYRLIDLLGRGGMGEVWRAYDTEIDRTVAIKMLLPAFAQDEKFEQRFRREARAAARLDEPHVVPIHDVGEIDGRLYVAMRLINGQDLQTLLDAGPMEPRRAVAITEQIAKALNAAHKVGLIHRDIKPSNILITYDDFAYLIDFGIARAAGETGLTSTGATIGTWSYMAPELFSTGVAEASSDIYALACVLYECLTGELPFPAVALQQIAVAHMTTPPPRPSTQRPTIPTTMDGVIATGMAKDSDQRYATTVELAEAAQRALTVPTSTPHAEPTLSAALAPPAPRRVSFVDQTPPKEDAQTTLAAATQRHAPPIGRNEWSPLKVAAVAAAVLIIAGIIVVSTQGDKSPAPAASVTTTTIPSTTSPTPTGAPPVAEAALQGLLLSPADINTAMGVNGMTARDISGTGLFSDDAYVTDKACVAMDSPAAQEVYARSGYSASRLQELTDRQTHQTYAGHGTLWFTDRVIQAVVLFPSAHDADAFFTASAQSWPACSNRQYTFKEPDWPARVWTVGPVFNTNGTLSAPQTLGGQWVWVSCQRALTVANNVVIDVYACSEDRSVAQSGDAVNIAHQIAAKVPTT